MKKSKKRVNKKNLLYKHRHHFISISLLVLALVLMIFPRLNITNSATANNPTIRQPLVSGKCDGIHATQSFAWNPTLSGKYIVVYGVGSNFSWIRTTATSATATVSTVCSPESSCYGKTGFVKIANDDGKGNYGTVIHFTVAKCVNRQPITSSNDCKLHPGGICVALKNPNGTWKYHSCAQAGHPGYNVDPGDPFCDGDFNHYCCFPSTSSTPKPTATPTPFHKYVPIGPGTLRTL